MKFKLSPMAQYRIVFYTVTSILAVPLLITMILAVFNPFWFRDSFLRWNERFATKISRFRDNIKLVKYLDDKAHLFDMLRE
jgi:hypothetical protein